MTVTRMLGETDEHFASRLAHFHADRLWRELQPGPVTADRLVRWIARQIAGGIVETEEGADLSHSDMEDAICERLFDRLRLRHPPTQREREMMATCVRNLDVLSESGQRFVLSLCEFSQVSAGQVEVLTAIYERVIERTHSGSVA